MNRILFVCHGNICRSPMAEFVMKHLVREAGLTDSISITSKALHTDEIGSDTHQGTRAVLDAHGIPYETRHAALMTHADYDACDMIIGMDEENMRDLARLTGGDPNGKVRLVLYYPQEVGRNMKEVLRAVKVLQISDANGVAMPADWPENGLIGDSVIIPPPGSKAEADKRLSEYDGYDFWFCHKKLH